MRRTSNNCFLLEIWRRTFLLGLSFVSYTLNGAYRLFEMFFVNCHGVLKRLCSDPFINSSVKVNIIYSTEIDKNIYNSYFNRLNWNDIYLNKKSWRDRLKCLSTFSSTTCVTGVAGSLEVWCFIDFLYFRKENLNSTPKYYIWVDTINIHA